MIVEEEQRGQGPSGINVAKSSPRERLNAFARLYPSRAKLAADYLKKRVAMTTEHPQKKHPNPPYRQSAQEPPGRERDMPPKADHGEVLGATGGRPLP
jgi:hypothetical protein